MDRQTNSAATARPLISVVVPTRDRPETLRSCLAGLGHHKSPRIEIVVQDNCSGPETEEVVKAAQKRDPRIRYERAPYPTSQRHNFELGLSAAKGDYLTIIGDDDGFCLGSLDWLADRLQKEPADAVRWNLVHYVWPTLSSDGEGFVRVYASHCYGGWRYGSPEDIAASTLAAKNAGSWDNVLIYHGMISRGVYDRMRAKTEGIFFFFPFIDIWAHNLIAFHCERLLQIDNPVSIYGTSGHSSGVSWHRVLDKKSKKSPAGQKWINEFHEDPIAARSGWQPDIRTLRYHDLCALEHAQRHGLLPADAVIDRDRWIQVILEEIRTQPWSLAPWLKAEPRAPIDEELFKIVRKHFAQLAKKLPKPPEAKYEPTYPDTLLRVSHLKRGFNDDVEGAMLALHALLEDGQPVYDVKFQSQPVRSSMPSGLRARLFKALRRAPPSLRKFARDVLPTHLTLRLAASGEAASNKRQTEIAKQLVEIRTASTGS
jgi:glycosyltransferase involved in cell wall biosynthesis